MTPLPILKVKYLENYPTDCPKLEHALNGDAGMDIRADANYSFNPDETVIVKTGLKFDIPAGYELQVRPRSGLSTKDWMMTNSPGTIDSGYKGEIGVIMKNMSPLIRSLYKGDRIAQLVFKKLPEFILEEVSNVGESERGEGGFGSTGLK